MNEPSPPPAGGRYVRLTPESEAIFVEGTDRVQTEEEKRALDSASKPKRQASRKETTTTDGSE